MNPRSLTRATWPDILGFLGLAALLGLAAGLLLGSMALLLAVPAYAHERMPEKAALLLRSTSDAEPVAAPLVSTEVRFRVSGPIVRARVVQTFENPADEWTEAVYVFPLPERAAIDHLRLAVGERRIEGEIRERVEARAVYAQARADGRRAALFDEERPNVFTTQVANIGPREAVVVDIEYQHILRYDGNRYSLRFPMVVAPRYVPEGPLRVADAHRIAPPVLHPAHENGRKNAVSIHVELDAGLPVAALESPYHAIHVEAPSAAQRIVTLADASVRADRDFELSWSTRESGRPEAAWLVEEKDGRYYGLLMLVPPRPERGTALPREVIFVLDTSGSMAGASIRQAKEALATALARLKPEDRFNVIAFNSTANALFADAREASAPNRRIAIQEVAGLEARGGTEMARALRLALAGEAGAGRVRQVVFLTDGAVGNEDELFAIMKARIGKSRLFTVGIGSAPNGHFMTKAARLGGGTFTFIGRIDEVRERMDELLTKLESPVLHDLALQWPAGIRAESWPANIPDLYSGEPLVLAVALDRLDGMLEVSGALDGRRWEARLPVATHAGASGVGSLWARDKVEALMDAIRTAGNDGAARAHAQAEIVSVALSHRLVTKYTSFVAVDRTPARPQGAGMQSHAVPSLLPAGWEFGKVFGELPQGATDSRLSLLMGGLCLTLALFAVVLWRKLS